MNMSRHIDRRDFLKAAAASATLPALAQRLEVPAKLRVLWSEASTAPPISATRGGETLLRVGSSGRKLEHSGTQTPKGSRVPPQETIP
jgi:hypothetical protein